MTFKIHAVYKEKAKVLKPEEEKQQVNQVSEDQSVDEQKSSVVSNNAQTIEQQRKAVLNSRSSVKPGTKISVKQSAYERGFESDMY